MVSDPEPALFSGKNSRKQLIVKAKDPACTGWHRSCNLNPGGTPVESIPPVPAPNLQPAKPMLSWTLTFIVVALIAGVLGFGGLAGAAATVAQVCFFIFLVLFVVSLIRGKKSI